jgi:glycoside/pentoside/hexuronide:cation symporter, GPH family
LTKQRVRLRRERDAQECAHLSAHRERQSALGRCSLFVQKRLAQMSDLRYMCVWIPPDVTTLSTPPASAIGDSRTGNRTRWLFGLAMFGLQITSQVVTFSLLFFYTDVKRLPPAWSATALTVYAIYNAVNNPLIGYLQDRTRSRWGRRLPYLRFGTLPMMIAFALIWMAPFDGNSAPVPLLIWFVAVIVIFDALNTAVSTAYYSLLPEMFEDYDERTDVAARMNIFLIVALLLGVALPPVIANQVGWPVVGIIFALLGGISLYTALPALFERKKDAAAQLPFFTALRSTFSNRGFLVMTLAQTMRFVTTNAMSTGMAFYVKYTLKLSNETTSLVLAVVFIVCAIALYPWRQLIARRFEPRTTALIGYATVALSVLTLWFASSLTTVLISAVLIGIAFAGIFLMDNILIADVIDEDEYASGHRREGMFYGINTLVITLSTAIVSIAFGVITSAYGYNTALTDAAQPASVADGFRIFMTLLPFLGCFFAFLALFAYPLYGERLRTIKSELARRKSPPSQ